MPSAVALRTDFDGAGLRRLARRSKDAAQARRLLALAAICDGGTRSEAATLCGMDRRTLRDWVHRYNEAGFDLAQRQHATVGRELAAVEAGDDGLAADR